MKRKIFIIAFMIMLSTMYIIQQTKSTDELTVINTELIINEESDMKEELISYIELIDNSLITQSSYTYSNTLSENYDFLVNFAISFILKNKEYYKDNIINGEAYKYIKENNIYETDEYVSKDKIYEITNDVFGESYFYIINEQFKDSELIPLLLLEDKSFSMKIEDIINIIKKDDNYEVYVKYKDNDIIYKYTFKKIANKLVIKNLTIGE